MHEIISEDPSEEIIKKEILPIKKENKKLFTGPDTLNKDMIVDDSSSQGEGRQRQIGDRVEEEPQPEYPYNRRDPRRRLVQSEVKK